ncbi:NDR1/HIN1-like protein 6 [Cynara cardunculus var. scolymus]|uniref:NDR1/HIN1-like protein 6 n=1 Tax=Cynara cardunculus var. scolymus TaxID=59895 RepID=UPI000D623181|nr:NDR1/HIN1-like protein 6 [Cynara cardunculus var. scolymus]
MPESNSMAEKIFPDTKPTAVKGSGATANATTTTANVNTTFSASKPQIYNAARPVYRSRPHRSRRSCYCYCCLWIIFIILLSTILAAIAGGILFLLYRPHRPSFSVSSLQLSRFNLTTRFNLTVTARNPNKNIVFYFDSVSVSINSKGGVIGDGTIPAFVTAKKSSTILKTAVRAQRVDDLKENKSLALKIELDSKVKVKIGSHMSKKAAIRVVCDGIKALATSNAECTVDLRIKIWKWTI